MDTINLGDLWDVQLRNGVMDIMTLDQMDAAYEGGRIDESTLVRMRGTAEWSTLGAIAGLDAPAAAAVAPAPQPSVPPAAPSFAPPAYSSPNSMAPMVADMDFDVPPEALRSSRKPVFIAGAAIAAVVAVIGFVVLGSSSEPPAAAAAPPPPAAQPLPVDAPVKVDAPATDRLSEDQKRALLSQDQKKDQARKKHAAPASNPGKRPSSGPVFHKGGNQYDPLNSNL